jgi:hypothetical protein
MLSCVLLPVLLGTLYTIVNVYKDFGSYYQNVFIQQSQTEYYENNSGRSNIAKNTAVSGKRLTQ